MAKDDGGSPGPADDSLAAVMARGFGRDSDLSAALREGFGSRAPAAGPQDVNLEDVALGLAAHLTQAQREEFRLIWARLCATSR